MSRAGTYDDPTTSGLHAFLAELQAGAGRREGKDLSFREIARRSDLAVSTVSDVFRNRKTASDETLTRIVDALAGSVTDRERVIELAHRAPPRRRAVVVRKPRLLPEAFPTFVGRAVPLDRISAAFDRTRLVVISGMGGVGKTCLAIHWAQEHARSFRGGHLYADLHGFDSETPVEPTAVLEQFLTALGYGKLPIGRAELTAAYRQLTGRGVLVVLDNAANADQVLALLPGAGATVLVTSRDSMIELQVRNGAVGIQLEPMSESEARDSLVARLGRQRVDRDGPAVSQLIAVCGGHPLALAIIGARLAADPDEPLAAVVADLQVRDQRLTVLEDLRDVISWSDRFDAKRRQVMALLCASPVTPLGLGRAAALFGIDERQAAAYLRDLERSGLVQRSAGLRYSVHDMIRLYYADQRTLSDGEIAAAVHRLVRHTLHSAWYAERLLAPQRPAITPLPLPEGVFAKPPAHDRAALAWFDAEWTTLPILQRAAAAGGHFDDVWQLAWCMDNYLYRRGLRDLHERVWRLGFDAAQRLEDPAVITLAELCLGRVSAGPEGLSHLERALARTDPDDLVGLAQAHRALSLREDTGRQALHHAIAALRLFRRLDEPVWVANQLNAVGEQTAKLGHPDLGRPFSELALMIHREHGNRAGEAATEDGLGTVDRLAGNSAGACAHFERAVAVYRELDNVASEVDTLIRLGDVLATTPADLEAARARWREALALLEQQPRLPEIAMVRRRLGAAGHGPIGQ